MYFLGRCKGAHLLGNFLCTKRLNNVLLFVFSFCDLVGRASSVCTYYDFVDFTLYYSDYNDFIGKNLYSAPIIGIFFKKN